MNEISIVIPCHNAEPYLAQTIGSVLDQTWPAGEIIVVDDGSTDGSLAVARRMAAHAPDRVRVLSECSGSAAKTRNLGALLATGGALMFLDADDVLAPDTLAALGDGLEECPGGIAACPWYRLKLIDGRWVSRPPSCVPRRRGEDALAGWLTGWYHPPCSVLWSREAFERAGRWEERWNVNDDGDLMMRALADGTPLAETARGAGYYRQLPESGASLSGKRLSRDGLAGRLRTVEKIAWWLEERRQARSYRRPLGEAFARIAADAATEHLDLAEQARAGARRYAPSVAARAWRNLFPPPRRPVSADGSGGEINFGMKPAEAAMRGVDPPPAVPLTRLDRPTVSVIIPTFNRAGLLTRALDSVLAQTFGDFEIIVVDDGSTDGTESAAARYSDGRLRYLRQPSNRGVCVARNRGLREARGEFIAFLDSDDEWFPDKLSLQVGLFRDCPEDVGLLYCGVENEFVGGRRTLTTPTSRGNLHRELLLTNVLHGGGSSVMIRRAVVATVGFFDEAFPAIEDYDYWARVARCFQIDFVGEPLVRCYFHREAQRKSLDVPANLAARERFYAKHAGDMQRFGLAHRFLLESARRHIRTSGDVRAARRLAFRAVSRAPFSRRAYAMLLRTLPRPRLRGSR